MSAPAAYPLERLPRFSRSDVRRLRQLARRSPLGSLIAPTPTAGWTLEIAGPPRLEAARVDAQPSPSVLLERACGARAWLRLPAEPAQRLIATTLGAERSESWQGAPLDDFSRGVLTYAIARGLSEGSGWCVAGVYAFAPAPAEALGEVERHGIFPLVMGVGDLRAAASLIVARLPISAPEPPETPPAWLSPHRVPLLAVAGSATLSLREWRGIELGDALIPDRLDLERVELVGPHSAWMAPAARCESGWRLLARPEAGAGRTRPRRPTRELKPTEDVMTDQALTETPITLTLEVARFELTVGDLAGLSAGEILETGQALDGRVVLRAGDRAIADGELVDIEGEVGVRILRLRERG